jgi:hypothetical protein
MAGSSNTLGSPWPSLVIRPYVEVFKSVTIKEDLIKEGKDQGTKKKEVKRKGEIQK